MPTRPPAPPEPTSLQRAEAAAVAQKQGMAELEMIGDVVGHSQKGLRNRTVEILDIGSEDGHCYN